jgi:hypothetical protein
VGEGGQFNVVKVNEARSDATYETHADVRLFAGAVSDVLCFNAVRLTSICSHGEALYSVLLLVLWHSVEQYFVLSTLMSISLASVIIFM